MTHARTEDLIIRILKNVADSLGNLITPHTCKARLIKEDFARRGCDKTVEKL